MSKSWPEHLGNKRDFKKKKRNEIRNAQKMLSDMLVACAYTPAYDLILQADDLLLRIKDSLSVKNWGR